MTENKSTAPVVDEEISASAAQQLNEGVTRLSRPPLVLLLTGIMGSLEIGVGLLAEYSVYEATGSAMLGSMAFAIGLVIIFLAGSELFTEGFLVPVTAVVAGKMPGRSLLAFWALTFAGNVIGAAIIMWLLAVGYPDMHSYLIDKALHYAHMSPEPEYFVRAALGGMILTLVTRMHQHGKETTPKIIASAIGGFLLSATGIIHSVLDTLFIFGGLFAGAESITVISWLAFVWWVALANLIGGLLLVSFFRFARFKGLLNSRAVTTASSTGGHRNEK
ncbi:formate/nitrite transporter family protein [Corynebacterium mendelii]|uniref:Formate/nitrite transporter family protein n=1 Tax=Corynebacterium mendelii TaxID=2765362 RepID=A0A939E1N3_9CORY|nr:formate/nitrite transporter family protein [Corynebacterium mendelii]MBN9644831.1 formate/nitrite transporter family protein [Corynebacterium mendelii]